MKEGHPNRTKSKAPTYADKGKGAWCGCDRELIRFGAKCACGHRNKPGIDKKPRPDIDLSE